MPIQKISHRPFPVSRIVYGCLTVLFVLCSTLFFSGCSGDDEGETARIKENVRAALPGVKADISVKSGDIILENIEYTLGEAFGPSAGVYTLKKLTLPGGDLKDVAAGDLTSLQRAEGLEFSMAAKDMTASIEQLGVMVKNGDLIKYLDAQTSSRSLTEMLDRHKNMEAYELWGKKYVSQSKSGYTVSLAEMKSKSSAEDRGGPASFSGVTVSQAGNTVFSLAHLSLDSWNIPGISDWLKSQYHDPNNIDKTALLNLYSLPISVKGLVLEKLAFGPGSIESCRLDVNKNPNSCDITFSLDNLTFPPMFLGLLPGGGIFAKNYNQPLTFSGLVDFTFIQKANAPSTFAVRTIAIEEKNLFTASVQQVHGMVDVEKKRVFYENGQAILENKGLADVVKKIGAEWTGSTEQELNANLRMVIDQAKSTARTKALVDLFENLYLLATQRGALVIDLSLPEGAYISPNEPQDFQGLLANPQTKLQSVFTSQ